MTKQYKDVGVDPPAVDQTSKTLTDQSKNYSTQDLLDPYELEFWFEEKPWTLN